VRETRQIGAENKRTEVVDVDEEEEGEEDDDEEEEEEEEEREEDDDEDDEEEEGAEEEVVVVAFLRATSVWETLREVSSLQQGGVQVMDWNEKMNELRGENGKKRKTNELDPVRELGFGQELLALGVQQIESVLDDA
jgi:hypothetical protein